MRRNTRLLLVSALLALGIGGGGCAHAPTGAANASTTAGTDKGDAVVRFALRYWQHLQALPADELGLEYERVDAAQRRHNEDLHARIQLALLRALPKTPFHDLDGALGLIDASLDDIPEEGVDPVSDLLWLLRGFVQEQKNSEQRLKALTRKSGELQSQLNQLKSIERSLENRTAPTPPAPAQGAP